MFAGSNYSIACLSMKSSYVLSDGPTPFVFIGVIDKGLKLRAVYLSAISITASGAGWCLNFDNSSLVNHMIYYNIWD